MNLFDQLKLYLPQRRIYFIYTHKNGSDRFKNGLTANTELSYWCFNALKTQFGNLHFLRLQGEKQSRINTIREKDIVIGHVGETFLKAAKRTKKVIAFYPWCGDSDRSENTLFNCLPKVQEFEYLSLCKSAIFLTSEYNVRRYIEGQSNFWHEKLKAFRKEKSLRTVHQPIDLNVFKRIKHTYETSDFFYVGNDAHMKCVDHSIALVNGVNRKLHLYGTHGKKLNHLDMAQVNQMSQLADFFIQPGMWEAQSVAILESAARGFIPIVSEETGYPYSHPYLLRYNDHEYNTQVLKKLLKTTPGERKALADELYAKLTADINHNNWEQLTNTLVEECLKLGGI